MHSWVKLWTTRYRKTKHTTSASEELGEKQGVADKGGGLCMLPALNTTKGWANHLSHPSSPTSGHTPILTPHEEKE